MSSHSDRAKYCKYVASEESKLKIFPLKVEIYLDTLRSFALGRYDSVGELDFRFACFDMTAVE